jgi:hypothetical protein
VGLGFPTRNPARACRGGTPARFWWPPVKTEWSTRCREARGARVRGRRGRLRPAAMSKGGWRRAGRQELRVRDAVLDFLRRNTNRRREEVRTDKRMRMG